MDQKESQGSSRWRASDCDAVDALAQAYWMHLWCVIRQWVSASGVFLEASEL